MRNAFASEITSLAKDDDRIVLLSGDIGNRLFDEYKKYFKNRFYNCGVAEANMTGIASGMAICGLIPITYTITPFNTYRCYEQIRVDICYNNVCVIIVGVGSGLSYASLGATHQSCEDIAIMRTLPNMTVICPGDPVEIRLALKASINNPGPVYLRLGKKGEPVIHNDIPDFKIGKGIIINQGNDACIINTGNTLPVAIQAANILKEKGKNIQVVSMHTVKPLDYELLEEIFDKFLVIATLEEHNLQGGIGSAIAEWRSDHGKVKNILCRFGTPDYFLSMTGGHNNARKISGLDPKNIAKIIKNNIG